MNIDTRSEAVMQGAKSKAREAVLSIDDLHVLLPAGSERPHAVEAVSYDLAPQEILCVVGESGSGKSLTARAVMGLLPAPHVKYEKGRILFQGEDLTKVSEERMRRVRGGEISMIFQEPMTALNPVMRIGDQIDEVIRFHETTALDVTTQAQILRLIKELQEKHDTGVLFITHDFGVVADIADRVAVMQHGRIVEIGPVDKVLNHPEHPYTRALTDAVPSLIPREAKPVVNEPILKVNKLLKTYRSGGGWLGFGKPVKKVNACEYVDVELNESETLRIQGRLFIEGLIFVALIEQACVRIALKSRWYFRTPTHR